MFLSVTFFIKNTRNYIQFKSWQLLRFNKFIYLYCIKMQTMYIYLFLIASQTKISYHYCPVKNGNWSLK